MRSPATLMAVWSNAVIGGREPAAQVRRLFPLTGLDVPVIRDGDATSVADLWAFWAEARVSQVRLLLPRPGRPVLLGPSEVANAAMRVGAALVAVGVEDALLPRLVRGDLVAWDRTTASGVDAAASNNVREAERDFVRAMRAATEWFGEQVLPAADEALEEFQGEVQSTPPPTPTTLPDTRLHLIDRAERVQAILDAARRAPEPISNEARAGRLDSLSRLETAVLTLQESAASGWVA